MIYIQSILIIMVWLAIQLGGVYGAMKLGVDSGALMFVNAGLFCFIYWIYLQYVLPKLMKR